MAREVQMKTMLEVVLSTNHFASGDPMFTLAKSISTGFIIQRMLATTTIEYGILNDTAELIELRRPTRSSLQVISSLEGTARKSKSEFSLDLIDSGAALLLRTNKGKKFNKILLVITSVDCEPAFDISDAQASGQVLKQNILSKTNNTN